LEVGHHAAVSRGRVAKDVARVCEACAVEFDAAFDLLVAREACDERLTILALDARRDALLQKHGFQDAFIDLKARENEKMLPLLPQVCRQIDALSGSEQLRAVIEGVFAGNIFDMGAEATAKQFLGDDAPDFFSTRSKLPKRPWLIDDFDALEQRLLHAIPHRKAVFFIDNAGSDFLLGALPMIRWLAQRGTRVILTANERPTLNDMTIYDVNAWWPRIVEVEPSLRDLPIDRVSSGTGEPLIDLLGVSQELNRAAADADLVILEGMGRGVESNLDAQFGCDGLILAMLKDAKVAGRIGGKLYDVVCQFKRAR
ncbi:MAG: ARMT1-like domain-containing protein, partial [Planctomycetota bacterium]|nr:ARMT1-like domain-containing protein [Planctomycetota bacterium]